MKLTVYKIICIVFFLSVFGCNSLFVSKEGVLYSSFEPSLLLHFYRKPVPPTPPNSLDE